jgi:hypothetical protein
VKKIADETKSGNHGHKTFFSSSLSKGTNKLECLSLESLSIPV